jgi:hypothetical protein
MSESSFASGQDSLILSQVYEGMKVYDVSGKPVGSIEYVYLGEMTMAADEHSLGWATASSLNAGEGSLIHEFASALLLTEEVPDFWREQLMCYGFLRIHSWGFLAAERYVLPEQIATVADNGVNLRVRRDELLTF